MNQLRNRLLIALVLLAGIIVAPRVSADAGSGLSTISEQGDPSIKPIDRFSGEPDVGQTSPTNLGRVQSPQSVKGGARIDDALRLAVWIWKARFVMTGF